jgi:virginiamycin A acetyltransferase
MTAIPDPLMRYPLGDEKSVVFLKAIVTNPQIEVGDYSYYHDFDDPLGFERNVRYAFPFIGDKLVIGKFCAIAHGAIFILNGGNHLIDTVSSFPFSIFGGEWAAAEPKAWPDKGGITIGHDVWIGYEATIMPGVTVGHGAVIAAKAVVTNDVPPYAIAGGNPARVIRSRHAPEDIAALLRIAWWDWPIERITAHVNIIANGSPADLFAIET